MSGVKGEGVRTKNTSIFNKGEGFIDWGDISLLIVFLLQCCNY